MTREWRKVQSVDVHNSYSLSYIIKMMKSRKMIQPLYVAHMTGDKHVILI
jgi:hypothetical protein